MPQRPAVGGAEPPPPDRAAARRRLDRRRAGRADIFDHAEPQMPEPPPRPARPSFADEVRRPAPPPCRAPERAQPIRWPASRRSRWAAAPEPPPPNCGREPMPSRVHLAQRAVMPRPPRPTEPPKAPPIRAPRTRRRAAATAAAAAAAGRRAPTRISPRWRSGWKPRCAGRPRDATDGAPPVAPEPPPARAARRAASRHRRPRAAEERL